MINSNINFLDISGHGNSGKGAITALLREFKNYYVPPSNTEFDLIRIQGGVLDLKYAIIDNWSPIRANAAIHRFIKICDRMGKNSKLFNPLSWGNAVGYNLNKEYEYQFFSLLKEYIENITYIKYDAFSPYTMTEASWLRVFFQKVVSALNSTNLKSTHIIPNREEFIEFTQLFLVKLLSINSKIDTKCIVMHNAFEPFNPTDSLGLIPNSKCIIIERDPRDIYVQSRNLISEGKKIDMSIMGDTLEGFINRYKYLRSTCKVINDSRIMNIKFEQLILNYSTEIPRILKFLNESEENHVLKNVFLKPEISKNNIGLWRGFKDQNEIRLIEKHLKDYCYHYE